jgi:hypothetical protein
MDTKKFEKLMDLVINEDNERAQELFHEIVVEKSREIFESIMAEEMEDDLEEGMGGQVGDLLDEINGEEAEEGMYEEEEAEMDFGDEDEEGEDFGGDMDMGDEEGGEEVEDAVIRIEDKLDQLMAEFEEIMGGGEEEEMDFGGEEEMDFGGEEEDFGDEDEEEAMMEAVQLQKVSVTHGDNGAQTKSPGLQGSGQAGMDSKPVHFGSTDEKGRTAPTTKDLKGAGSFKNSPGKDNFKEKGEAAPKPKHGDDGANTKSPVAESRRPARRPIR